LSYSNATIEDLVSKDTDGDSVPDWEEGLWGTDPTKKETTPGIPDRVAIDKLKTDQGSSINTANDNPANQTPENLTQTDKFARDLFATVAATSQNGALDPATIDQITSSLADNIQNSPQRKVFTLSDIKIIKDDSVQAINNYSDALNIIDGKFTTANTVLDVLQKFIVDDNNVDVSVLAQLDPIIQNTNKTISDMVKMPVPQSLSDQHLAVINALEKLAENVSDIKLYDTDPIVSLGAISQYDQSTTALQGVISNLNNAINQKLNN
jgi:hypothetical protein